MKETVDFPVVVRVAGAEIEVGAISATSADDVPHLLADFFREVAEAFEQYGEAR